AMFGFSYIDYNRLGESLLDALDLPPNFEQGAFHLLLAFVAGADLWVQTQILYPRNRTMENAIVMRPVKALALLLERRHDEARQPTVNRQRVVASNHPSLAPHWAHVPSGRRWPARRVKGLNSAAAAHHAPVTDGSAANWQCAQVKCRFCAIRAPVPAAPFSHR